MNPNEIKNKLIRDHHLLALYGTNNNMFYCASTAPINDKKVILPDDLKKTLGISDSVYSMYDLKSQLPYCYDRLFQLCVISLCSNIEFFFKEFFSLQKYPAGRGAFFQRFNEIIESLEKNGFVFRSLVKDLKNIKIAFSIRHICVHNLGYVDQPFIDQTNLSVKIGTHYIVSEDTFKAMYESYCKLLKHIDESMSS